VLRVTAIDASVSYYIDQLRGLPYSQIGSKSDPKRALAGRKWPHRNDPRRGIWNQIVCNSTPSQALETAPTIGSRGLISRKERGSDSDEILHASFN